MSLNENNDTKNPPTSFPSTEPPTPPKPSNLKDNPKFKETLQKFNDITINNSTLPSSSAKKGGFPKKTLQRQKSLNFGKFNSINSSPKQTNVNNSTSSFTNNNNNVTRRTPVKRVHSLSTRSPTVNSGSVDSTHIPPWVYRKKFIDGTEDKSTEPPKIPPKPKFNLRPTSAPRPHRHSELHLNLKVTNGSEVSGRKAEDTGIKFSKSDLSLNGLGQISSVDDKGRRFVEGKPRDVDYYKLGIDAPEKKKRSLKGFAKGLRDLLPSRSHSDEANILASIKDVDENALNAIWVSTKREPLKWKEFDTSNVPQDLVKLIDLSVLKEGFHVEFGENSTNSLELGHKTEYVSYYTSYLYVVDHVHYLGYDEETTLHWIISVEIIPKNKREFVRVLVRNRANFIRYCIDPHQSNNERAKGTNSRLGPLFKYVPEIEKIKFFKSRSQELSDELHSMELKEVELGSHYKFGVIYVKPKQTEDEIFANENISNPDLDEFLNFLGEKVELKGFKKYSGGLDTKNGGTGEHSIYTSIHDVEIMFHVCTMLPSQEDDVQRVERKRHIGNDVVVFVFLEKDCEPYLATKLTSQFIHIHFVFQKVANVSETEYRLSVVTKAGVEPHSPHLPFPSIIKKTKENRDLILTKAINAERTTMLSPEFKSKMLRARKEFLKHLYNTYKKKK